MKKIVITGLFFATVSLAQAQSMGDITKATNSASKAASTVTSSSFDVASISNQVMGLLSPKLKLTDAQKPAVNALVNETLNKKKNLLPSLKTDKTGYTSKMTANRESFTAKMKKLVNPSQFSVLSALLPKSASSISPLTQMLF